MGRRKIKGKNNMRGLKKPFPSETKVNFSFLEFSLGTFFLGKIKDKVVWAEFGRKGVPPFFVLTAKGFFMERNDAELKNEISILKNYFKGEKLDSSSIPLEFIIGTEKEKKVWEELLKIPCGEIITYSYLAEKLGIPNAQRFIGNAVGKNPIPIIIPCHRVIRKDGKLGGFSAGLHIKNYLLQLESSNK